MIPVSKPFLPPQETYLEYIKSIYASGWLTNNGPLVQTLEDKIKTYTGTEHFHYVTNGTIALQLALKSLGQVGEIITTPFSFVATLSSIVWEGFTPVFVDIDAQTFNIDVKLIESAITDRTVAILATHVYGNPCDIDAIQALADRYNLKVIYDAAHCFGSLYKGKSAFTYGDISITSFHATKLYHTVEGGGLFTRDEELARTLKATREFGQEQGVYTMAGINGKNSEFHAAMGLSVLPYMDEILSDKQRIASVYDGLLADSPLQRPRILADAQSNLAYYPIFFPSEAQLVKAVEHLAELSIFPRRYFAPSLNQLPYVNYQPAPIAENAAKLALCLPNYYGLEQENLEKIAAVINKTLAQSGDTRSMSSASMTNVA